MIERNFDSPKDQFTWTISKKLLLLILEDKVSDVFVCELVWERLFYVRQASRYKWISSLLTPSYWSEKYVDAPEIIAERPASVHLTRSIPKDHKQGLKSFLNFKGYKINELYPRRTRRATAVNWLIYWTNEFKSLEEDNDNLPELSFPSSNPTEGHYGDPNIN
tara:strand:- start:568 stop:1056 length:489 start_codon:yes stop_codon:yes gene_type:complete